jgi:hypothetical protein
MANVFGLEGESRVRVQQHCYQVCEWFCHGAMAAGAAVEVYHCDVAGDCDRAEWVPGKGELWAESKHAPFQAKYATT